MNTPNQNHPHCTICQEPIEADQAAIIFPVGIIARDPRDLSGQRQFRTNGSTLPAHLVCVKGALMGGIDYLAGQHEGLQDRHGPPAQEPHPLHTVKS